MRFKLVAPVCAGLMLAATALAPVAQAQEGEQPTGPTVPANCIPITLFNGVKFCINAIPQDGGPTGALGYGSFGTGSLSALFSQIVQTGSNALSLEIPIRTGSYAPGSTGSYGPEASVGQLSAEATGSLISGSVGGS